MKKRLFVIFSLIVFILISNVIAFQSTITVKTGAPNQEIIFKACDQATGKTLDGGEFRQKADSEGKVVFEYNLEPVLIKMSFMIWGGSNYISFVNGKQTIFLNNVILDQFVDVDLNKAEPSFKIYSNDSEETATNNIDVKVEVTETNTTNITEPSNSTTDSESVTSPNSTEIQIEEMFETPEEKATNTELTGAAINSGKGIFSSAKTYFILIGILVLFGFVLLAGKLKKNGAFKTIKLSEILKHEENGKYRDEEIAHAEKKLKEVQEELETLKNKKERIKEVQEKLKQDKEELRRLGGKE